MKSRLIQGLILFIVFVLGVILFRSGSPSSAYSGTADYYVPPSP